MVRGRKPDFPNKHKLCKDPDFPDRLEQLRFAAGLEVHELCSQSEISRSYYSQLKSGGIPQPGQKTLLNLARALKVRVDDLWQANNRGVDHLSLTLSANLVIEIDFHTTGQLSDSYYRARNQIIADLMSHEGEWRQLVNDT